MVDEWARVHRRVISRCTRLEAFPPYLFGPWLSSLGPLFLPSPQPANEQNRLSERSLTAHASTYWFGLHEIRPARSLPDLYALETDQPSIACRIRTSRFCSRRDCRSFPERARCAFIPTNDLAITSQDEAQKESRGQRGLLVPLLLAVAGLLLPPASCCRLPLAAACLKLLFN